MSKSQYPVWVLNGPNLNRLGTREPDIYGDRDYDSVVEEIEREASALGFTAVVRQTNDEAELIAWLHDAADESVPVIMNPAAFTHTSIALRDALLGVGLPFIEIHLSNVHAREPFRHSSFLSDIAVGVIAGLGPMGYSLALRAAASRLQIANPKG